MNIPFALPDLSIWLGATAIILLITSEILGSSQEYSSRILINKKRMRYVAIGCGIAYLVTVILQYL